MRAVDIIHRKRDGHALTESEIQTFVHAATHKTWPDYQLSALLMAIYLRGMNAHETAWLTDAMANSGTKLDLSSVTGFKVGKHSSGGVGDKTSLVLVPLVAACGAIVPKMSGRGLGHTGGTLDKLESIPGYRVDLSIPEFLDMLNTVGCAIIGQTKDIAPADKVLYALRDVTATVESIPLISSSIMSKKIAEGIQGLVLDVKCGKGAFMKTPEDAEALAKSLVSTGKANGVKTKANITNMDIPLGRAVGNSLEVIEAIETLKGIGPKDLECLSVTLAAQMLQLANDGMTIDEARSKIGTALSSGCALQKFTEMIDKQGGDAKIVDDAKRLPLAKKRYLYKSSRNGYVSEIHAELVGKFAMQLGAGRQAKAAPIDHSVGIKMHAELGQLVRAGEPLAEIYYRDEESLAAAKGLLEVALRIGDEEPVSGDLVMSKIF